MTCLTCHLTPPPTPPVPEPAELEVFDRGDAGASLGREHDRRKARREQRTREAHPRIGELLLRWQKAPQHETAFRQGQLAEESVAASLARRTAAGPTMLLHNRRMPGGRGDIDHIAVAPTGVFVVDTKDWGGSVRVESPLFAPRLLVGGRDRTKLADGLDRQVAAVRAALEARGHPEITIQGVFCLTRADKPLFGITRFRGHLLLYRKALAKRLNAAGDLGPDTIKNLTGALADAFPPA